MSDSGYDRESLKSPCIGVCRIEQTGLCAGCLRTLQEIANWSSSRWDQRQKTLANVEARRRQRSAANQTDDSLVSPG